jgi:hypothetical protein
MIKQEENDSLDTLLKERAELRKTVELMSNGSAPLAQRNARTCM